MKKKELLELLENIPDDAKIIVGMCDDMQCGRLPSGAGYRADDTVFDKKTNQFIIIAG